MVAVRSPMEEEAQIRAERLEDLMFEQMKGGKGQNPAADQKGLERGKIPQQAPAPEALAAALQGAAGPAAAPTAAPTTETPPPAGPAQLPAAGGAPEVTEQDVKRALRGVKFVGKVHLVSVGPDGIRITVTREADEPRVRQALEPLGLPVDVQVSDEKAGVRLRGKR